MPQGKIKTKTNVQKPTQKKHTVDKVNRLMHISRICAMCRFIYKVARYRNMRKNITFKKCL